MNNPSHHAHLRSPHFHGMHGHFDADHVEPDVESCLGEIGLGIAPATLYAVLR